MPIFRVKKNNDYTVISNYHLKEKKMSLKAKGLLSQMLSLPDNWDYSISGLVLINKENETAIKSTLDELKEFGYLKITKKNPNETATGKIEYVYDIYEKPFQNQELEKQDLENLGVENQGQLNINKLNTKNNNTSLKVSIDIYKEIVDYMNTINEHDNFEIKIPFYYKYTSKDTQSHINARIRDGYDIEDFKDVIYWGYFKFVENQFQTETEGTSVKYFRPSTLFSDKHFGEYLNEYRARTSK